MRFGTDGIRGRAGEPPIDEEGAARAGAAAGRLALALGNDATVYVARDTRPSGPDLAKAALWGAGTVGARPVDVGVLPTSGLQAVLADARDGRRVATGVMITASHNPADDNGFKILGAGGAKPDDATTARLEAWLDEGVGGVFEATVVDGAETALDTYARALATAIREVDALRGRRVAIDLARGAATAVREVLGDLLHGVDVVWTGIDGGAVNDGVGSEHPEHLAAIVRAHGCAAGLAVDGDGDRALLVDERGEVVPGDALTWVLARALGVQRLAVTVMSSGALEASLPGVEVVRTPVGDRHLAAAMADGTVPLGAEESGHVLFRDGLPGGDGLVTGLRALGAIFSRGDVASEVLAPFPRWPRRLTKVRAGSRPDLDAIPEVVAARKEGEAALGNGRVFLRWSGTEPVLRILVEGRDEAVVQAVSDRVTAACAAALGGA